MSIKYHIRQMQKEDLEEVTALEASCFSMPWKYKDFEDTLNNPDRFYFVAVNDENNQDKILGGCMLTSILGEGDISNVAVREEYRKNNIASALLEKTLEFGIQKCGISAFTLEVRSKNEAALGLYGKLGFVSEGIRPNFYDKPKDDAIVMWKRQF